jgi:hypothetical protein
MSKKKDYILKAVFLILILGIAFYWYGIRPSKIKHDCSWIMVTKSAVAAHSAFTEKELKDRNMIKICPSPAIDLINKKIEGNPYVSFEQNRERVLRESCENDNNKIISEYKAAKAEIPVKESWRKSTTEEYLFCLRDKGL